MTEETTKNWVDELIDELSELLSDNKTVKFTTHRNRKNFILKVKAIVKEKVEANILPITVEEKSTGPREAMVITRPNPNKEEGYAVMTEKNSNLGDESLKQTLSNHKAGVRKW
jgi:hypothetical protein